MQGSPGGQQSLVPIGQEQATHQERVPGLAAGFCKHVCQREHQFPGLSGGHLPGGPSPQESQPGRRNLGHPVGKERMVLSLPLEPLHLLTPGLSSQSLSPALTLAAKSKASSWDPKPEVSELGNTIRNVEFGVCSV